MADIKVISDFMTNISMFCFIVIHCKRLYDTTGGIWSGSHRPHGKQHIDPM